MTAETNEPLLLAVLAPDLPHDKKFAAWCRAATANMEVQVLWCIDADFEAFAREVGLQVKPDSVRHGARLLIDGLLPFGSEMRAMLTRIATQAGMPKDWYLTRLFECNFAEPGWFDALRSGLVVETLEQRTVHRLVAVGNSATTEALARFCRIRGLDCRTWAVSKSPSRMGTLTRAIATWIRNGVRELCISPNRTRATVTGPVRTVLLSAFPNNWSGDGARLGSRFAGPELSAELPRILAVTRKSQRHLRTCKESRVSADRALASPVPTHIIETFGRWDVVRCYAAVAEVWRWHRAMRRAQRAGFLVWRGLDLEPFLRTLLFDGAWVDLPKNRRLRMATARAARAADAKVAVVPVFELCEGRALVAGAHDAGLTVVGMQHGPIGAAHLWRFVEMAGLQRETASASVPDRWAVEADRVRAWLLEAGIPGPTVQTVGAPRLTLETPLFQADQAQDVVMVLGEMHAPTYFLEQAMEALSGLPCRVVVRPHPATFGAIKDWIRRAAAQLGLEVCASDGNVALEVELATWRPKAILVGTSGAAVALAQQGWPIAVLTSNWLPNGNPLLLPGVSVQSRPAPFVISADTADIRTWVTTMLTERDMLTTYSGACRAQTTDLVAATGIAATERLRRAVAHSQHDR